MLDRGVGGGKGLITFLPPKRGGGLLEGEGFNIGFTVYFTIIEVKKIIHRRFFISRFHVCRVALVDKSTKLRILIIYMFHFYSFRRCRVSFFFGMVPVSAV